MSKIDYKYGIFAKINKPYGGPSSVYWTNTQIKDWCDKNDVYYESTDKRTDFQIYLDVLDQLKKSNAQKISIANPDDY